MRWRDIQDRIASCRTCEACGVPNLLVPDGAKHHPPLAPPKPTELMLIAIAPPWNGRYFWDEAAADGLRGRVLALLTDATGRPFRSLREFCAAGYYLLPAVKCPSGRDDRDHRPAARALWNCARHLRQELEVARPTRVMAIGLDAMRALAAALELPAPVRVRDYRGRLQRVRIAGQETWLSGTYYAGNNRHRGRDKIVADIRNLLGRHPLNRATPS